jgi:hypothetical protein
MKPGVAVIDLHDRKREEHMTKPIGRIEKPRTSQFRGKRKVFVIPMLYTGKTAPEEYAEKYSRYWEQVEDQLEALKKSIGVISKIYHESISQGGEKGLQILEKLNLQSFNIARREFAGGAELEGLEDKNLLEETMDWERCLLMGLASEKARELISHHYLDSSRQRYQYISDKIDKTLESDETALLFIRDHNAIPFPGDVEVFTVNPPVLDDIHRFLRRGTFEEEAAGSGKGGKKGNGRKTGRRKNRTGKK